MYINNQQNQCCNIYFNFRYSGILMGITNTFGTIPGFVSPIVVQELTGQNVSRGYNVNLLRSTFHFDW